MKKYIEKLEKKTLRQTKRQKKKNNNNQLSAPQRSGDILKTLKPGHKKLYGFWEPMASSWTVVRLKYVYNS